MIQFTDLEMHMFAELNQAAVASGHLQPPANWTSAEQKEMYRKVMAEVVAALAYFKYIGMTDQVIHDEIMQLVEVQTSFHRGIVTLKNTNFEEAKDEKSE